MLELKNLKKEYLSPSGQTISAINDVSLKFEDKGLVFLLGKSGSGKTTMLNVIGGLDRADSGEVIVKGKSSKDFTPADFDSYRNTFIGFVFQEYNILEEFSIEDNIALALKLQGKPNDQQRVDEILAQVGLENVGKRKPNTLSGGQKQRVAIARALIKDPEIIMADEPTGALDSKTGDQIFEMLKELSKNKLVIVVSHDRDFAEKYGDRIIELADGKVISDNTSINIKVDDKDVNVKVIDNKIAVIKDIDKVSAEELKTILASLSKKNKEIILTSGTDEITNFKQSYIPNENVKGFSKTEKVITKDYNPADTKFIKSKLPAKDAFKIGVSGLKAKPIRLCFTIFLSVLAFCMFGVMSTLMMYSPAYTMSKALSEKSFQSLVLDKNYSYVQRDVTIEKTGERTVNAEEEYKSKALFTSEEIATLNNNAKGLNYIGVFTFDNAVGQKNPLSFEIKGPQHINRNKEFYKVKSIMGFSDCGEDALIKAGGELLAGKYPEKSNEIAVTEYVYNLFRDSFNYGADNPASPDLNPISTPAKFVQSFEENTDLRITLKGKIDLAFRVVGVYKVSNLDKYYDYKDKQVSNEEEKTERAKIINELENIIKNSFDTVGFVSSSFYQENSAQIPKLPTQIPDDIVVSGLKHYYYSDVPYSTLVKPNDLTVSQYTSTAFLIPTTAVNSYINSYKFYSLENIDSKAVITNPLEFSKHVTSFTLADNECFLPKARFLELFDQLSWSAQQDFNNGKNIKVRLVSYHKDDNNKNIEVELKVKGLYEADDKTNRIIVNDKVLTDNGIMSDYRIVETETTYLRAYNEKYNYIVSKSDNSEEQLSQMLVTDGDVSFGLVNKEYGSLFDSEVVSLIEQFRKIAVIAAIVVGIFAGLMLLNFISASITAKRKEIGILRAVGARSVDLYKIFFAETFILTVMCFILASVLGYVAVIILNAKIYELCGLTILKYGFINILLILAISFFISCIATVIPVAKEAKKSPVESIRLM